MWLHVKLSWWSESWRIWVFPSRIRLPFTATTWVVLIWLGTCCSTYKVYWSAWSLHPRARSSWRCRPSTHQHEYSNNRHLHQSPRSGQASAIYVKPWIDDPWRAKLEEEYKRELDILQTGYQPKRTSTERSQSKLSLRGRVENQAQPSLGCEHTLRESMSTQSSKVTTTLYTLTICHIWHTTTKFHIPHGPW